MLFDVEFFQIQKTKHSLEIPSAYLLGILDFLQIIKTTLQLGRHLVHILAVSSFQLKPQIFLEDGRKVGLHGVERSGLSSRSLKVSKLNKHY